MPRVGQTSNEPTKPKEPEKKYRYGRDRFLCPVCGAVHWAPFKDGCHNDNCPYQGVLIMERGT